MIYFIQSDDGPIKIGWTMRSVEKRLLVLQIGTHHILSVLATCPGDKQLEKEIQDKFKDLHIRGEWYKDKKRLLDYINSDAISYQAKEVSWPKLCHLEPGLKKLEKRCYFIKQELGYSENFCANALWYGYDDHITGIKEKLSELVGWSARKGKRYPFLESSEAYDFAYEKLYSILPDCKHTGSLCLFFCPEVTNEPELYKSSQSS